MNVELPRLIEALRWTLSEVVAPELGSDFARGQLAAVHDILGKLAGLSVWDPQALRAQAEALEYGNQRFEERAARAGVALPENRGRDGSHLVKSQSRTCELIDWFDGAGPTLPMELAADLHAVLCSALREQLLVERKRIPLTDFSAMTAAAPQEKSHADTPG